LSSAKRLILIRHAHRDKPFGLGGIADNGLSAKGLKQAERVREYFKEHFEGEAPLILSSPKKRCRETVAPIAKMEGVKVQESEDLNEGEQVEKKAKRFLEWWKEEAPPLTVACSHGDWIPEFTMLALGEEIDLNKAGWLELKLSRDEKGILKIKVKDLQHDL
jgi:phosphohistidine phosphatase SixA